METVPQATGPETLPFSVKLKTENPESSNSLSMPLSKDPRRQESHTPTSNGTSRPSPFPNYSANSSVADGANHHAIVDEINVPTTRVVVR